MCERKRNWKPKVIDYSSTLEYSKTAIDIDLCASPMSEEDESPLRSIFCLKTREKMREVEEKEDCFILGFDPYDISKLSVSTSPVDSSRDLLIIAEKGQVFFFKKSIFLQSVSCFCTLLTYILSLIMKPFLNF